ncbi:MAG: type II secretion system F family protein [Pseudomonadota bacterium]
MDPQLTLVLAVAGLAFASIVGIGFAFSGNDRAVQQKRLRQVVDVGGEKRGKSGDADALRKRQFQDTVKTLREKEAQRRKSNAPKTVEDKIKQAGFTFSPATFWIGSAVIGLAAAFAAFVAGLQYYVVGGIGFAAALGLPRWLLGFSIGRRQKKFSSQFADAIDVIVRGVKSGLPLIECLRIIAKESPQPIAGEFERVIDGIAMGSAPDKALGRMYARMPLPEVNFFNIVIAIQSQAGGNLSEALGNLSAVLRSRKMLREKIGALSSEAKASAMIIGALPFIVMVLVYLTNPEYIIVLFTETLGNFMLMIGGCLMAVGIFVMRQMINFDF